MWQTLYKRQINLWQAILSPKCKDAPYDSDKSVKSIEIISHKQIWDNLRVNGVPS